MNGPTYSRKSIVTEVALDLVLLIVFLDCADALITFIFG